MKKIQISGLQRGDESKASRLLGLRQSTVNQIVRGIREDKYGVETMLREIAKTNIALEEKAHLLRLEKLKTEYA